MSENPFNDPALKGRHRDARLFKWMTRLSLLVTVGFLVFFLVDIVSRATPAFQQAYVQVEVDYNKSAVKFGRRAVSKENSDIVSRGWTRLIPQRVRENPELEGTQELVWVPADDQVDQYLKGHHHTLNDKQVAHLEGLREQGRVEMRFNKMLFTNGDSKLPEYAGLKAAVLGSIATMA